MCDIDRQKKKKIQHWVYRVVLCATNNIRLDKGLHVHWKLVGMPPSAELVACWPEWSYDLIVAAAARQAVISARLGVSSVLFQFQHFKHKCRADDWTGLMSRSGRNNNKTRLLITSCYHHRTNFLAVNHPTERRRQTRLRTDPTANWTFV